MSELTDEESTIVRTALAWYHTKKPVNWTLDEHDRNPQVNCVGQQECELAVAVRDWLVKP